MKKHCDKLASGDSDLVVNRLRRIAGQVRGIELMVSEGRSCELVLHQLLAVRSAVSQVATKILAAESCRLEYHTRSDKLEKLLKRLIDFN